MNNAPKTPSSNVDANTQGDQLPSWHKPTVTPLSVEKTAGGVNFGNDGGGAYTAYGSAS